MVPFNRHEILVVEAKIYKNTKQKANQQARPEVICKESALNHHKRGLVQEGNPVSLIPLHLLVTENKTRKMGASPPSLQNDD